MHYYIVSVNSKGNIYSFSIKSHAPLSEQEIIDAGIKNKHFQNADDSKYVKYIGEINEFEYNTMR